MDTDALRWLQQVADGTTVTEVGDVESVTQSGVASPSSPRRAPDHRRPRPVRWSTARSWTRARSARSS